MMLTNGNKLIPGFVYETKLPCECKALVTDNVIEVMCHRFAVIRTIDVDYTRMVEIACCQCSKIESYHAEHVIRWGVSEIEEQKSRTIKNTQERYKCKCDLNTIMVTGCKCGGT